jgi:GTP-binding protein Era
VDPSEGGREINDFIMQNLEKVKSPLVLAINKIDLIRDKGMLLPMIQKYSILLPFEAVIPISALTGDGVGELLDEIKRLLPEGPRYFPEDYLTDQPERFFVSEIVREKIFRLLHEEVPYAVAVTVEKFSEEPERNFIHIEATVNVERDSQKAIIIGKKGQMLKEIGSQARRDIEVLLGCRVYLGLFVRVQKNWKKDRRALQEFGYHSKK